MVRNSNAVPRKQWTKWSDEAKNIFNSCYTFFIENQRIMNHPKAPEQKIEYWTTVAWNAAWIAADSCDDTIPTEVIDVP